MPNRSNITDPHSNEGNVLNLFNIALGTVTDVPNECHTATSAIRPTYRHAKQYDLEARTEFNWPSV